MLRDEVLCQVAKSEPCRVIQGDCLRCLGALGIHGKVSISVVNPKPRRKVWLVFIKHTFHLVLDAGRDTLYSRLRRPVFSRASRQPEILDTVKVNAIVQSEENPKEYLCTNPMRH